MEVQDICSICTLTLEGGKVMELECSHIYHTKCGMQWLRSHDTCPLCRDNVGAKEEKGEEKEGEEEKEEKEVKEIEVVELEGNNRRDIDILPQPVPAEGGRKKRRKSKPRCRSCRSKERGRKGCTRCYNLRHYGQESSRKRGAKVSKRRRSQRKRSRKRTGRRKLSRRSSRRSSRKRSRRRSRKRS